MERNGKETENGCPNCRFWVEIGEKPCASGECHRHAPAPAPLATLKIKVTNSGGDPDYAAIWPVTVAEDWCGDWECEMRVAGAGMDLS